MRRTSYTALRKLTRSIGLMQQLHHDNISSQRDVRATSGNRTRVNLRVRRSSDTQIHRHTFVLTRTTTPNEKVSAMLRNNNAVSHMAFNLAIYVRMRDGTIMSLMIDA